MGTWNPIPQDDAGRKKYWEDRVAADPVNAYAVKATATGSDPNARANPMGPAPTGTGAPPPPLPGGQAFRDPAAPAGPPQEGVLSGPGYQEDWYKNYGQDLMGSPSASEDLYSKGAAGSNPFYDYAQQQMTKGINDQAAARGNYNSSYTMNRIGTGIADLRGQQAHELGQLAGQADSAKQTRYGLGERFAGDAQSALETRVRGGLNSYTDLADKQAGRVSEFYGPAGKGMNDAEMAAIEAMLKEAGLSAAEIENLVKAGGEGASLLVKALA